MDRPEDLAPEFVRVTQYRETTAVLTVQELREATGLSKADVPRLLAAIRDGDHSHATLDRLFDIIPDAEVVTSYDGRGT